MKALIKKSFYLKSSFHFILFISFYQIIEEINLIEHKCIGKEFTNYSDKSGQRTTNARLGFCITLKILCYDQI